MKKIEIEYGFKYKTRTVLDPFNYEFAIKKLEEKREWYENEIKKELDEHFESDDSELTDFYITWKDVEE